MKWTNLRHGQDRKKGSESKSTRHQTGEEKKKKPWKKDLGVERATEQKALQWHGRIDGPEVAQEGGSRKSAKCRSGERGWQKK